MLLSHKAYLRQRETPLALVPLSSLEGAHAVQAFVNNSVRRAISCPFRHPFLEERGEAVTLEPPEVNKSQNQVIMVLK
jgi:hypothetical protein